MRIRHLAAFAILAIAPVARAQGVMADMHGDVNEVQSKFIKLANAFPESAYDWRPGDGVRSVRELFLHITSDNYLLPIFMGKQAPPETGITADGATAAAFEKKPMTKAQVIAALTASFTHMHQALALISDNNLSEKMSMFGSDMTKHKAVVATVTHMHEHLGQAIAYARVNKIVPPWSQ